MLGLDAVGKTNHRSEQEQDHAKMPDEEMKAVDSKWDETMEMALFYAAIKFKPVGEEKLRHTTKSKQGHTGAAEKTKKMINLHRHFNKHSHTPCTIAELWEKLGTLYDLQALDEREDSAMFADEEDDESDSNEERDISFKNSEEFVLPLDEFDHVVNEIADPTRASPSPVRTTKREGSMTPSVAASSRASSEDDEATPRKRRPSRVAKKSDLNETSSPRTSSGSTPTSSTRRATRAKTESTPVTRGRKTGRKISASILTSSIIMIHRKSLLLSSVAVLLFLAASVVADSVHDLTPETFDSFIGSKPALVEFYAPWCGHCKNLAPVYEELGEALADKNDKVLIAKVNADEHKQLGARFGVREYPTIKWFPNGINSAPEDYKGGCDLHSLASFVTRMSGVRAMGKRSSAVEVLTDATFDQTIGKTGKSYLVEFYAPWCAHCEALAPAFEKLGRDLFNKEDAVIAKIDATKEPKTAEKYKVSSYPTIMFFDAEGNVSNYEGSEFDLVALVNKLAGTNRLPGGRLGLKVGRIPQLDEIAVKFTETNAPEEKKINTEGIASAALEGLDADALVYARTSEMARRL
ncbi:hypothetical protein BGX34_008974 [Mortierella sp. NVP85]|nr:hypothetical protein BGX34_008974 [Mortierella sp. NVP85]